MHRLEMSDPRELSGHVTASLSTSSLPTIDVRTIASGARHHGPFGPEASQAAQDVLERRLDLRLELRDLLPAHEDSISLVEFEELLQRWEPPSSKAKTLKSLSDARTLRGVGAGGRNGGALTR